MEVGLSYITESEYLALQQEDSDDKNARILEIFGEQSFQGVELGRDDSKLVAKAYKVNVGESTFFIVDRLAGEQSEPSDTTKRIAKYVGALQKSIKVQESIDINKCIECTFSTNHSIIISQQEQHVVKFSDTLSRKSQMREILSDFLPNFLRSAITKIRHQIFQVWGSSLEANKKKLVVKKNLLEGKIAALEGSEPVDREALEKLKKGLARVEADLGEYTQFEANAKKVRESLELIGAERVRIHTRDRSAELDGMYLSASSFKQALREAGAKQFEMQIGEETISGFCFDKEGFEDKLVIEALTALGAFPEQDPETKEWKLGAGWSQVEHDGKVLILRDDDAGRFEMNRSDVTVTYSDIEESSGRSTNVAVISSGTGGIYEMHKREVLAFLMRGIDVVAFNPRGYGESEGTPSKERLKEDFEAIYGFVRKKGYEDKQILLKPMSMSSGPSAYLVKKHPDINILIDQGYSSFRPVVQAFAREYIDRYVARKNADDPESLRSRLLEWFRNNSETLTRFIAWVIAPNWRTRRYLSEVRGKVGMIVTRADKYVPKDRHAGRMQHKKSDIQVYEMDGGHGASWVRDRKIDFSKLKSPVKEFNEGYEAPRLEHQELLFIELDLNAYHSSDAINRINDLIVEASRKRSISYVEDELRQGISASGLSDDQKKKMLDLCMRKIIAANLQKASYDYFYELLEDLKDGRIELPNFLQKANEFLANFNEDQQKEVITFIEETFGFSLNEDSQLYFQYKTEGRNNVDAFLRECGMVGSLF